MVVKTIIKHEFLNWLKDQCAISDPSSSLIYEGIASRVEGGEFDNTNGHKMKARVDCEFLLKKISMVPYEDSENDEFGEFMVYHNCSICDKDFPCLYPAKLCNYKRELEDFMNHMLTHAEENINEG